MNAKKPQSGGLIVDRLLVDTTVYARPFKPHVIPGGIRTTSLLQFLLANIFASEASFTVLTTTLASLVRRISRQY